MGVAARLPGSRNSHRPMTTIYALSDPRTSEVRYVGKTAGPMRKRMAVHRAAARLRATKRHVEAWVRSLLDARCEPAVIVLEQVRPPIDWRLREQFWIATLRRVGCRLTNLTIGGDGSSGTVRSESAKAKWRAAMKGRPGRKWTAAEREAWSKARQGWRKGCPRSEATKNKLRLGKLGPRNPQFGRTGAASRSSRPIEIDGVRFHGIADACRLIHRCKNTVRNWLRSGRARYIDRAPKAA